mgnify:CR=1 FL=1
MRTPPLLTLAAALALGGCTQADAAHERADAARATGATARIVAAAAGAGAVARPHEVIVRTRDFAFAAPDTVESGTTTFRLINDGPDFHHLLLVRLEDGHTATELMQALAQHGPPPAWATLVGGPNTPGQPGLETRATLALTPGNYVMLCVIPAKDGKPHIAHGMVKPLTVVPSRRPTVALPPADLVMTLDDYSFRTSRTIAAGRQTIRIENAAQQPHEVVIVKLQPGKTAHDMLAFMAKPAGSPPGTIVGGNTPMAKGQRNQITVDFTPGEYALLCFVPDAGDGKPHFLHGMVQQITVS